MSAPVEEWMTRAPFKVFRCPSKRRFPREEAAFATSDEWAIFAVHNNYVRPIRDYEWYPGEPCRLRSAASQKMFELPPGAVPYSISTLGHSATSWDPFVFPNPPRSFLMSCGTFPVPPMNYKNSGPPPHSSSDGIAGLNGGLDPHLSKLKNFRRRVNVSEQGVMGMSPIDLADLERQLWFDPEPRLERPFRMYADSRYCSKGPKLISVSQLMRPGCLFRQLCANVCEECSKEILKYVKRDSLIVNKMPLGESTAAMLKLHRLLELTC